LSGVLRVLATSVEELLVSCRTKPSEIGESVTGVTAGTVVSVSAGAMIPAATRDEPGAIIARPLVFDFSFLEGFGSSLSAEANGHLVDHMLQLWCGEIEKRSRIMLFASSKENV
jgi:hypothetical protein